MIIPELFSSYKGKVVAVVPLIGGNRIHFDSGATRKTAWLSFKVLGGTGFVGNSLQSRKGASGISRVLQKTANI
jgi:hypothetical protein